MHIYDEQYRVIMGMDTFVLKYTVTGKYYVGKTQWKNKDQRAY